MPAEERHPQVEVVRASAGYSPLRHGQVAVNQNAVTINPFLPNSKLNRRGPHDGCADRIYTNATSTDAGI